MFLCKNFIARTNVWRRLFINNAAFNSIVPSHIKYNGFAACQQNKYFFNHGHISRYNPYLQLLHRKWCSNGLLEEDKNTDLTVQHGKVLKNIKELFPLPRVTLNELINKAPTQKIFYIQYKQNTVAPKGKKKSLPNIDWTCTYVFVWPMKAKFESTAVSKRQAAEKAATRAIHWLYVNQKIDSKGHPIFDEEVLLELRKPLNDPIHVSLSDQCTERIETIWKDYENGIKEIYEATLAEAKDTVEHMFTAVTKDSTIDEDDLPEKDENLNLMINTSESERFLHPVYGREVTPPTKMAFERRYHVLKQKFRQYDEYVNPLPIDDYSDEIISILEKSRVVVVKGAAGCGKSTRVPAAILRHCGANMAAIVSEPRRVAAIGLAGRVASELGEEVGDTVGYQVRLQSKHPKPVGGSILYCTSGVLLRRLQSNPGLVGCTHAIIDEAHERDVNTDVSLLLLKRALDINKDLKVLIMSATLDTEVFTRYFNGCPVIEVPGKTFPVKISYLEEIQDKFRINLPNTMITCLTVNGKPQVRCQEVADLIIAVDKQEKEGAILVFLPGWSEIKLTKQLLDEQYEKSPVHMILPVHSRLSTSDQEKMFETPSRGIRKIVLATNVAETSITIPDVVYVIDTGAHKENRIKEGTGIASLETVWVSLASSNQRAGRAGRVQPGFCYRMYTEEKEAEFVRHSTPEILRIPLVQTVLDCKSYAPYEKVVNFLSQLPQPPNKEAIKFAVDDLIELGALNPLQQLTRLGSLLSSLTLHPRIGRCLLHSAVIGNVVAVSNMVAHCSSNIEVFANASDRRDEIRGIKRKYSATSDYAALYEIQNEFEQAAQEGGRAASDKYCGRHGLRGDRLGFIRSLSNLHLEQLLKSSMIVPTTDAEELDRFSNIDELVCGVLISGTDELLMTKKNIKTKGKLKTVIEVVNSAGERAHIASESVNTGLTKHCNEPSLLCYFGGHHSVERRALVVYKTCLVPPHTPLLFSIEDIKTEENGASVIMSLPKHRLKVHVPTRQADLILKAREMLWKTFEYYIERDVKTLDFDDNTKVARFKARLIKAVARILAEAHVEHVETKTAIDDYEELG